MHDVPLAHLHARIAVASKTADLLMRPILDAVLSEVQRGFLGVEDGSDGT